MRRLISLSWTIGALVLFNAKHLIADFMLQPDWMALGKAQPRGWLKSTAVHALVHAVATGLIFGLLAPRYLWLAVVDFVVHFSIDRSKALVNGTYELDISKQGFWLSFGVDQSLHELTNIAFALVVAAAHTPA
jgi:hypothetical protein